jgi:hypothetical protein
VEDKPATTPKAKKAPKSDEAAADAPATEQVDAAAADAPAAPAE